MRVGDPEVQLGRLGRPSFVDPRLLVERAGGGDGDDCVFGGVRRYLMKLTFSVTTPLPRGYDIAPHGPHHTRWEGFFN